MSREALEATFMRLGCRDLVPGFYNDKAFLKAEQREPELLDRYAEYVLARGQDADVDVEGVVRTTCDFLFTALCRHGRLGACIDISTLVSEFLGRQRVWSFVATGGARVDFPKVHSPELRMSPITAPDNPASTGHAWVVAPPFQVLDLTIFLQPYPPSVLSYVPHEYVAARGMGRIEPELEDLVDPEVEAEVRQAGGLRYLRTNHPKIFARATRFGAYALDAEDVRVRWVATSVIANDKPLEEWRTIQLDGLWPSALWAAFETAATHREPQAS